MKSYKELLIDRINIRCALWTMGLISDTELNNRIINIESFAKIIETKKCGILYNCFTDRIRLVSLTEAKVMLNKLESSNLFLINKYFK